MTKWWKHYHHMITQPVEPSSSPSSSPSSPPSSSSSPTSSPSSSLGDRWDGRCGNRHPRRDWIRLLASCSCRLQTDGGNNQDRWNDLKLCRQWCNKFGWGPTFSTNDTNFLGNLLDIVCMIQIWVWWCLLFISQLSLVPAMIILGNETVWHLPRRRWLSHWTFGLGTKSLSRAASFAKVISFKKQNKSDWKLYWHAVAIFTSCKGGKVKNAELGVFLSKVFLSQKASKISFVLATIWWPMTDRGPLHHFNNLRKLNPSLLCDF